MENARIQRLILSEYNELSSDTILVESPFAETTRDGRGVREVAVALTKTKLIVATDVFEPSYRCWCLPDVDPCIETLELLSIYPLKFITLSVFRKRRRKTLKARFIDGRAKYYELGGIHRRAAFWTLWCKHVQSMIECKRLGSSLSETTVAASSTCPSTSYKLSSDFEYDSAIGRCRKNSERIRSWCYYNGAGKPRTWTQKNLYLGSSYEELQDGRYKPVPIRFADAALDAIKNELKDASPRKSLSKEKCKHRFLESNPSNKSQGQQDDDLCNVIFKRKSTKRCDDQQLLLATELKRSLNREEGGHDSPRFYKKVQFSTECTPSVVLDIDGPESNVFTCNHQNSKQNKKNATNAAKVARILSKRRFAEDETRASSRHLDSSKTNVCTCSSFDPHEVIENGVSVWERTRNNRNKLFKRNLRRYGISTATYFLYAFGPWAVYPGDRESLQNRRSHSCVSVRRQPIDQELRLPVSRRQLAASISLTDLNGSLTASTRGRVVLFWTPDYWYRPRAAVDAYQDIRRHLDQIKEFQAEKERHRTRRGIFGRRGRRHLRERETCNACSRSTNAGKGCISNRIFLSNTAVFRGNQRRKQRQQNYTRGTIAQLRHLLKLDYRVTLWDLDSTTLARQLTLVDLELFLRIPKSELEILTRNRTSRDAPNFGAWIAFAHRMSCLIASEVLTERKMQSRARLIARLLSAADKCFNIGNFHSTRSILAGLQSPAIYRLTQTWAYLKLHHATKYETMEKLSKIFKNPKMKNYRKAWLEAEKNPPLMPFVGDVLSRLLDHLNDIEFLYCNPRKSTNNSSSTTNPMKRKLTASMRGKRTVRKLDFSKVKHRITQQIILRSPRHEESRRSRKSSWTIRQRNLARRVWNQWRAQVRGSCGISRLENWLERCQRQARNYDFAGQSLAWEFLLKARYREDRDNFFLSLQVEPRRET